MSPLNLFFDNGLRNPVRPGTIATHGSPQDNPQARTPYTNSFGSPVAVQPVPRIRRVRCSPKDFQDQLESLEYRVPMASTADKVGPMRVGAGGADHNRTVDHVPYRPAMEDWNGTEPLAGSDNLGLHAVTVLRQRVLLPLPFFSTRTSACI
jgi:hypothetical protein